MSLFHPCQYQYFHVGLNEFSHGTAVLHFGYLVVLTQFLCQRSGFFGRGQFIQHNGIVQILEAVAKCR